MIVRPEVTCHVECASVTSEFHFILLTGKIKKLVKTPFKVKKSLIEGSLLR